MKTVVVKELFLKVLTDVYQAVSENAPIAILSNFHVAVSESWVQVSGTDMELSISEGCGTLLTEEPFEMAVPATKLVELIRLLQDDILTLSLEGDVLRIKTPSVDHRLKTFPAKEFSISWSPGDSVAKIPTPLLKRMIDLTVLAADTEQIAGGVLIGVYLDSDGHDLAAVATDRYRYTVCTLHRDCGIWSAIVPAKQLSKVSKILQSDEVEIGLRSNLITFCTEKGNTVAGVLMLEGVYPKYHAFPFRYEEGTQISIPVPLLLNAARQANLFVNSSNSMKLSVDQKSLMLNTTGNELGSSDIRLPANHAGKEHEATVYCNPHYVSSILEASNSPSVTMEINSDHDPILLHWSDDFVHGIMPIAGGKP